MKVRSQNTFHS